MGDDKSLGGKMGSGWENEKSIGSTIEGKPLEVGRAKVAKSWRLIDTKWALEILEVNSMVPWSIFVDLTRP